MKQWICEVAIFSQQNNFQLIFRKSRYQTIHFILSLALSLCLMTLDYHYQGLVIIHRTFSLIVAPLQYAVDYPLRVTGWIQSLVSSKRFLINENIKLHYQQTMLEAELQKLMAIKKENSQLKQLLLTSSKAKMKAMASQILAVDTTNSRQMIVLDKGTRDNVYIGQPVLDAKGIMGQVIDVGYMTSTVLLISDSKCAVPVRNNRTGEHAILVGANNVSQLSLINLPKTSSVKKGDLLITSGLGRLYPEGYPVGRVEHIKRAKGEDFIKVSVTPIALLNRDRLVLLIWPDKEQVALTQQINERLSHIGKMA